MIIFEILGSCHFVSSSRDIPRLEKFINEKKKELGKKTYNAYIGATLTHEGWRTPIDHVIAGRKIDEIALLADNQDLLNVVVDMCSNRKNETFKEFLVALKIKEERELAKNNQKEQSTSPQMR